jgi:hypothetical protein
MPMRKIAKAVASRNLRDGRWGVSDTRKQPPHHFKHVDMKPCCMACMHNTAEFDHDFISCDVHKFTMPDVALFRVCDNFKGGYGEKNECDSVVELLKQKVARLEKALGRIKAHTNITWIKDVCKAALEG